MKSNAIGCLALKMMWNPIVCFSLQMKSNQIQLGCFCTSNDIKIQLGVSHFKWCKNPIGCFSLQIKSNPIQCFALVTHHVDNSFGSRSKIAEPMMIYYNMGFVSIIKLPKKWSPKSTTPLCSHSLSLYICMSINF
jgi:hypothetical protein